MRKVYASFPGNTWCGLSLAALCPTDSPTPVTTRAYPFGHSRRKQQYYWAAHTAHGRRKRPLPYGERTRRGGGGRDEGRERFSSFRDAFCSMPQQAQKHPAKAGCGDAINGVPTSRWGPALAHIELSQSPDGFRFVGHAPAEHLAELVWRLPLTRRYAHPACEATQTPVGSSN